MMSATVVATELGRMAPAIVSGSRPSSAPPWSRQHNDVALANALAIVAHDLRGPLANLSILMEVIEAHSQKRAFEHIPARARQACDMIHALDGMLSSLLERVRTTGDPLGFAPSLIDLNDVVDKAMALNRPVAESRSVRLHGSADEPLTIWGDRCLLLQAVENLINNAVKHSRSGMTVMCDAAKEDPHGDRQVDEVSLQRLRA